MLVLGAPGKGSHGSRRRSLRHRGLEHHEPAVYQYATRGHAAQSGPGFWQVSSVHQSLHTGAHIDSPLHVFKV